MLDGSSSPSSSKSKRGSSEDTFGWARVVLLGAVVIWQVYTLGRLGAYASHLVEARDRHEELQGSLRDAQVALSTLHNNSKHCEAGAKEHATQLADVERERKALQLKLEEVEEYNMLLNQTASAREGALRAEQAKRLSLEGSVQTLKEQMNLMQGQLVTAQQQQGTLHGGSKRGHHKH